MLLVDRCRTPGVLAGELGLGLPSGPFPLGQQRLSLGKLVLGVAQQCSTRLFSTGSTPVAAIALALLHDPLRLRGSIGCQRTTGADLLARELARLSADVSFVAQWGAINARSLPLSPMKFSRQTRPVNSEAARV
jgi:hypothetical protein